MGHRPLAEHEHNPFLGLRSIRLSLRNLDLFRPQLRAILRAAVHGDIRVMFPLITTLAELRQARMLLNVVAEDLAESGTPHRSDIPRRYDGRGSRGCHDAGQICHRSRFSVDRDE